MGRQRVTAPRPSRRVLRPLREPLREPLTQLSQASRPRLDHFRAVQTNLEHAATRGEVRRTPGRPRRVGPIPPTPGKPLRRSFEEGQHSFTAVGQTRDAAANQRHTMRAPK